MPSRMEQGPWNFWGAGKELSDACTSKSRASGAGQRQQGDGRGSGGGQLFTVLLPKQPVMQGEEKGCLSDQGRDADSG